MFSISTRLLGVANASKRFFDKLEDFNLLFCNLTANAFFSCKHLKGKLHGLNNN